MQSRTGGSAMIIVVSDCIICCILAGELPASFVYRV